MIGQIKIFDTTLSAMASLLTYYVLLRVLDGHSVVLIGCMICEVRALTHFINLCLS